MKKKYCKKECDCNDNQEEEIVGIPISIEEYLSMLLKSELFDKIINNKKLTLEHDNEGQVVLYTGLKEKQWKQIFNNAEKNIKKVGEENGISIQLDTDIEKPKKKTRKSK